MNIYKLLEEILEELADGRQEGESIADYKKRKANELEKHFTNKEDEARAKARAYSHQYKKEKKEWKNNPQIGAEKALDTADKALNNMIKSSDARRKKWEVQGIKKKMNKNEALEIMEEIINEVSVKRWKEAAANSLDKRKEAADATAKYAEQSWDDYDRISRKHPEDEPQLYRLAQANDEVAGKAEDSADHAYAVTRLRTHDKANANKAIKAARKVADKRDDEFSKKLDKRTFLRMGKADQLVSADPVKSRANEALSLIEAIINEVSVKRWKEAAKNSIEGREAESDKLNDIPIGAYLSGSVSPKHAEKALKAMDRESRARYLAKNLPDSDKSASKLKGAAKNSVEGRSKDSDNAVDQLVKAHKEYKEARDNAREKGEKQISDDIVDKANMAKKEYDKKLFKREDRARALAGKELRRAKSMKEPALVKTTGAYHEKVWQDEALEIMEEIISEVSDEKAQKALDAARQRYDRENYEASMKLFKGDKKGAEEGEEKSAEKFNKHLNLQLKRAERKGEKLVQDKDDHDYFRISNEAFDLMEQIVDYADNLFELDYEEKQNISPNKISRTKKDKNGEKVEVVSVADELFPYEGDAKQQFNQKVLAKINDMIEGTGSLEDLIQFVRAGAKAKKIANEGLYEGVIEILEKHVFPKKGDSFNFKKVLNKNEAYEEALNILEENIKKLSVTRELRGRQNAYNQQLDNIEKNINRAKIAKGYRREVLLQNADDADKKAAEANKKLRKTKGEILDGLRKRGATNPQAHEIVGKMLESVEGLFTNEDKNIFGKETGQGSLENDISKTVTGKALNQHIENGVNKVIAPKKVTEPKKIEEALDLVEEIINEVSVKRWKEAATNSIPTRQAAQDTNQADYNYFSGRIPKDMQRNLDKEHAERDAYHNDRVGRAEYLSKNLPNSKRLANQVKDAANKVVNSRSAKSDKYNTSTVKNAKIATELGARGDKELAGKYWDKAAKSSDNKVNSIEREDHARSIAGKTLRDATKETGHKLKEKEGTRPDNISYKEHNKDIRARVEKAEKAYNKADDKKEDIFGRTEKDRVTTELISAQRAADRKFSKHKR